MSDTATLTSTVAGRYATALFELAQEAGALDQVAADLETLSETLAESADLRRLIASPLYGRDDQGRAMRAVSDRLGLGALVGNVIGVMAGKRRLFALPDVIADFRALLAEHRGETTAEVTAARPLSEAQADALTKTLGGALGRTVKLDVKIDPAILGGLVVKVGSRMVDTSIRSKLAGLKNAMREVG
ncbi:MAG: F0F1 ATP synthase subunit delta [Pikeienuella sp.]